MNETTELIMRQLNSKKTHAETHELGGGDEIDALKLKNIDALERIDHSAKHELGGSDEIDALKLKNIGNVVAKSVSDPIPGEKIANYTLTADKFVPGALTNETQNGLEIVSMKLDIDTLVPKRHVFGGQISKLKESLSNPLEQITGIVFVGDSITWGRTLPGNSPFDPRDGTLSDPRDNFSTPSFVNEFKRYIGATYAFNASPVLSNWAAAPSGQAIAEYTVQNILYPKDGDFTLASVGGSVSLVEAQTPASLTGFQLQLADGNVAGTSHQSVSFKFTGDTFTLAVGVLETDATFYDLYVDGVKIGTYSTHAGVDGFVQGNNQQRTHTFPYVRNKTVEIRSNRNGENTGNRRLRLEAIIVNKRIRITNQGINGATCNTYKTYNLAGNTFGDGEAVGTQDNYVFVQLGTNDRITRTDTPKGANKFKGNLKLVLDKITPLSNVILMCSNPAVNESTSSYSFNMQNCRDVIYRTAKENSIDMIDNYTIFNGVDMNGVTADGLHPNTSGHAIIARNITNSLEYS